MDEKVVGVGRRVALLCLLLATVLCGCSLFDKTPPEIEGKSPVVEYGVDLGISEIAEITDDSRVEEATIQKVLGGKGTIIEEGTGVNFEAPGEYRVLIAATDHRGNSVEAECPVSVIDNTSPVILSVDGPAEIGYGETIVLMSATDTPNAIVVDYDDVSDVTLAISAIQKLGASSSANAYVRTSDDSVQLQEVGDYILTLSLTDAFGNSSTEQRTVSVVDNTPPMISGLDRITISEYDALPSFIDGVTAEDEIDGDLSQLITVDSSAVEKGVPGSYKVVYTVADLAGNEVEQERVVLIEDTTPPVLSVSSSSLSFTVGDSKPDYKSLISATDANDGDLTTSVTIDDSGVNYSTPGTYNVTYTVKDSAGNTATKTLKVTIKAKTTTSSSGSGGTVYITNTGSKYHRSGCRYLSRSKIAISKTTAIARGYTACSVCRP